MSNISDLMKNHPEIDALRAVGVGLLELSREIKDNEKETKQQMIQDGNTLLEIYTRLVNPRED